MSATDVPVLQDSTHKKPVDSGLFYGPISNRANDKRRDTKVDSQTVTDTSATVSAPSRKQVNKTRFQFIALCWTLFLAGWNDGSIGPLLPRIQKFYNVVGFTMVSLIFVVACVGYISGALANLPLSDQLGLGKVLRIMTPLAGSLCQIVAYTIQAPALPFPMFIICFAIIGFGLAIQESQAIGYVASIKDNAETRMGILHACYGAGALCSPLVATQFAQARHWSFHYLISLGIAISNTAILIAVFRFKTQDECLVEIGQSATEKGTSSDSTFRQILSQKTVHLLAFFSFVYVGVEVTLGGWSVTYVIDVRGGGPSSGYISTGFFSGLSFGRVGLLWVNKKVGERRVLFIYALLAIGLELVIWFVPSLVGDAVAVALVGMLLGPMFPISMNHARRVLPRWLLTGSVGWVVGFGQAGSAVLPFMAGALSSKFGIKSLQPLLVVMMSLMTVFWLLVPGKPQRTD
ncbi:MFS general substrate transporter [Tricholoma matsutake]|nr:MFS general substrate transporter [Tricholoma matsutake 945]